MGIISIIKYQLYLLQLEEYEIPRYWRLLLKKGYFMPKQPLRNVLVWTLKARLIFALTLLVYGLAFVLLALESGVYFALAWLVVGPLVLPILYTFSLILLRPLEFLVKRVIISKAKNIVKSSNVKIIGIAGSYGKTTMKNVLTSILSAKLKAQATPKSVNTPVGIAQWLIKSCQEKPEVLIIEMGEHYRGDIKNLCSITPPDIAILCGINEAHLERLKNIENSIATIFEIVEGSKEDALLILSADDQHIRENYQKYVNNKNVSFYSYLNNPLANLQIKERRFDVEGLFWSFTIEGLGEMRTRILGEYILGDIIASVTVAQSLGLSPEEIRKGINKIEPIEHRLQPVKSQGGILVIDDSYNGNPKGAHEAIGLLSRFQHRRKIFLTPGLVETGPKMKEIHKIIGRELAGVANLVILIKNSVTPHIAKGLVDGGFDESKIVWFNTAQEAHNKLGNILKPNDVILFQNDWGDQYL
ncbi:MAG: UDP-N-acetylmuramoyl-tripeptide--D-alanyl-D-alanine ligase [Candidatus Pacebacteria bacterium]|nr:UDP-N-acetylmuramoyl-tripeptide--D-alanyl-D-alanine ligase [Candidatus Paceibacterota bacterium]